MPMPRAPSLPSPLRVCPSAASYPKNHSFGFSSSSQSHLHCLGHELLIRSSLLCWESKILGFTQIISSVGSADPAPFCVCPSWPPQSGRACLSLLIPEVNPTAAARGGTQGPAGSSFLLKQILKKEFWAPLWGSPAPGRVWGGWWGHVP